MANQRTRQVGLFRGRIGHIAARCAAILACSSACAADGVDPNGPDPDGGTLSFSGGVQPIFTDNCAFTQCHAGASPQADMNLSEGMAYQNIVNVSSRQVSTMVRVAPGEPDSSYLVLKIEGRAGSVGGVATRMPLGGMLTQAQIDTIRRWMENGAENN